MLVVLFQQLEDISMKTKKHLLANTLLVIVPSFTFLIVAEFMFRGVFHSELSLKNDERSLMYSHHDTLGWFPSKNTIGTFKGLKEISVRHNSRGFRDEKHEPGVNPRMMVLGDSFVWGYDVEEKDRFTEVLDKSLNNLDVFNLGVSGYGTDQQWILLQKNFNYYRPEVVFLMYCADNDRLDNRMNLRYRYFYKPYFLEENDSLIMKGVPVPEGYRQFYKERDIASKSYLGRLAVSSYYKLRYPEIFLETDPTFALISKMKKYSEQKGSVFIVGLQKGDKTLEYHLKNEKISFLNVENDHLRGWHWDEGGHAYVAQEIESFLKRKDLSW